MSKFSLSKNKIKILLLEGVHQRAVQELKEAGYTNIDYYKGALDKVELKEKIRDAHILGIRSRVQLDSEILSVAQKLIAVGCFCIGTNQVDLDLAKKKGIPVFNAPYSNTRSVAELVIAEAIMLLRGASEKNILAHQGIWQKSAADSYEARGKKLGIVGYGHIGSQVSVLAEAIGMDVYYYDIEKKLRIGNATPCKSFKELLNIADIVTMHVPATQETKNLLGPKKIKQMKKGAFLINASRGNVVDIPSLVKELKSKNIRGAAIDVFPEEPASKNEEFISDLRKFPNVILTPHIGGSTLEAQENIGQEVAEKLVTYSDNGSTVGATNFVAVTLPAQEEKQRFFHIHENKPGVMDKLNKLFSKENVNIASQYLQTDSDIGYVITDIDGKLPKSFLKEIQATPHTIKSRMLY